MKFARPFEIEAFPKPPKPPQKQFHLVKRPSGVHAIGFVWKFFSFEFRVSVVLTPGNGRRLLSIAQPELPPP